MSDSFQNWCIEQAITDYKKITKRAIPADVANEIKRCYLLGILDEDASNANDDLDVLINKLYRVVVEWADTHTRFDGLKNKDRVDKLLKVWGAHLKNERGRESVMKRIGGLKTVLVTRKTYERIESGTPVDSETWVAVFSELGYSASLELLFGVDSHYNDRRVGLSQEIRELISDQWKSQGRTKHQKLATVLDELVCKRWNVKSKTQAQKAIHLGVHVQTYRKLETARGVLMIDVVLQARANCEGVPLVRNAHDAYQQESLRREYDRDDPSCAIDLATKYVSRKVKGIRLALSNDV